MHERFETLLAIVRQSGRLAGKAYECTIEKNKYRFSVKRKDGHLITSVRFRFDDDLDATASRLLSQMENAERALIGNIVKKEKATLTFRPAIGGFEHVTGASGSMRRRRGE